MKMLDGKVCVITGAGSGMGRATALRFADEGARVVAVGHSGSEQETAKAIGESALGMRGDVSVADDMKSVVERTMAAHGRLDVLCCAAGIHGDFALTPDYDEETFDRVIGVNLRGVWLSMKYAIPAMLETGGGSIVNWGSLGGIFAAPAITAYLASKGAVHQITKGVALEYGPHGIRANVLCPGFVVTPMHERGAEAMGAATDEVREAVGNMGDLAERAALRRAGTSEEIAAVAAFLACDDASFVTGAVIPVDGGWLAGG
jgi:NAD(P)-dependent dehydrogenase (short-subunit alcohol dehydrogenase family)